MAVDELLGKEEIVIKTLGGFPQGVGPFAGATISGEGRVILLVDPARLVAEASLAKSTLGWAPRHAGLETIVRHAWQWEQGRAKA